ncbi:hypothetical protein SLEP1_g1330 [Rubroshorea leprosula]|uniref:Uncharacterized protein n=1 Tax=Rubroshorea leprosula TaxID=152421 RepID=A0AAV5HN13_9ROSI|nr:hypothetical protein SLEP1_g1330 [Rubroshorea leprosula]
MEEVVPCPSLAVTSALRIGTVGAIWGLGESSVIAHKKGLNGITKASLLATSAAKCSFQCGVVAGVFQMTYCWIERHLGQKDWKNSVIAGAGGAAAAGASAAIVARKRKLDGMIMMACLLSGINAEFS